MRFDTRLVLGGHESTPTGDVVAPVHLSVGFEARRQDPAEYFYSRGENPTRDGLESCLAGLEEARHALTFATGQAAATAVIGLLGPGAHVVCSDDVYSGTRALLEDVRRFGISVEYADLTELSALERSLSSRPADLVWIETPTNPMLKVVDIRAVSALAPRAVRVVDNTFATPALQQPLRLGATISLYSTTKYVAGHADVLGGALVLDDTDLHRQLRERRMVQGNVPGALDCFLVQRGLRTLGVRIERQVDSAQSVAEMLAEHPGIAVVHFPGLAKHPQYALASAQMRRPGAMVTFDCRGDTETVLRRTKIFAAAVSLGGVRSLIECPATMSHRSVPAADLRALGVSTSTLRLSIGLEDPQDLIEDLQEALRD